MAWIFFQELEDSPLRFDPGCGHSLTVKTTDSPKPCFSPKWVTADSQRLQSGTTCRMRSISSTEDFRARILARLELEEAWRAFEKIFGKKEDFKKEDLVSKIISHCRGCGSSESLSVLENQLYLCRVCREVTEPETHLTDPL